MRLATRSDRRTTVAVRRGEVLSTPDEAQIAVDRAVEERQSLHRARYAFAGVGVIAAVGVIVGIVGPFVLVFPSAVLLIFIVVAHLNYLPRLDRNLERAEELNRAAAGGDQAGRG